MKTISHVLIPAFLFLMIGCENSPTESVGIPDADLIDAIRSGGLNKYLIRPISFYTYHLMMFIGQISLFYMAYFTLITVFPLIFFKTFPGNLLESVLA